jgi:hypothetical protein
MAAIRHRAAPDSLGLPAQEGQKPVNYFRSLGTDLERKALTQFRIRIWNKTTAAILFDNERGASDAADPYTPVGSGSSVVIQK